MKRGHLVAVLLAVGGCALGGCALIKTSAPGTTASSGAPAGPSAGSSGHRASPPDDEPGLAPPTYPDTLLRSQLVKLVGLAPDQAKQTLRSWGHTGNVNIAPGDRFDPSCREGTICKAELDTTDISLDEDLTLHVNPTVTLSAPPP